MKILYERPDFSVSDKNRGESFPSRRIFQIG
jgi:hypothetical protein